MWKCPKCGEQHDDQFDSCWKCSGQTPSTTALGQKKPKPVCCPHCDTALDYVGTKRFHEGGRWGLLGDLGELFVRRENFDIFVCSRCGRVEFFVDGIGEELRPQRPASRGLPTAEEAFALYEDATKRELKGDLKGALTLYEQVLVRFPSTEAASDATKCIESLKMRIT
jgi:hypothetical protein